jgi:hypothetical protein
MSPLAMKLLREAARHQGRDVHQAIQFVNELRRFPGDPTEVSVAWQELQTCGLIVVAVKPPEGVNWMGGGDHHYYITLRGREWLNSAGSPPAPEDPDGFLAALAGDDRLDPFVRTTVAEAVWAYGHQRPVSALVCLCAAAERMVRMVDNATSSPKQAQNISQVWESLEKRLVNERKRPHVVVFLSTTFTALRDSRNDVAHKGTIADLAQVRRFLLQYLDWHDAAATLRDHPLC